MNSARTTITVLALTSATLATFCNPANAGTYRAWGANISGCLGNGNSVQQGTPVEVTALNGEVTQFATGLATSYALMADGTVKAWGANWKGQLGNGNLNPSMTPVTVQGLTNVVMISASDARAFALKADGTIWGWGDNEFGALGVGYMSSAVTVPTQVGFNNDIVFINAGFYHSLAIRANGTVVAWGFNYYGQLGNGTNIESLMPVPVMNLTNVVDVAAGDQHSIAVKADGTLWAWGNNDSGQLCNGTITGTVNVPTQVVDFTNAVKVAAGVSHCIALLQNGDVYCWGRNQFGQIGSGTNDEYITFPYFVVANATKIDAGEDSSYALTANNMLMAWGENLYAQLGDGVNETYRNFAAPVAKLGATHDFVAGTRNVFAVVEWPDAPVPSACPADVAPNGGDGTINVMDLLQVINSWGMCP
jgi:alpha-tubulin suppressor-like RCC1 family protein